jgi:lipopolysaccharide export system permease protein
MFARYFIGRFLRLFFLILFSSIVVFLLLDFVGNIKDWLKKEPQVVFDYYLNYIPHILFLIMPINVLLTTTAVVGGMARHLEWAAMKTAGFSIVRLMSPLYFILVLITGGMYILGEYVLPDANHRRLEIAQPKNHVKKEQKRDKAKYQFVYISDETKSYYFKRYSSRTKSANKPTILFFEKNKLIKRLDARSIKWKKDFWIATDVWERIFFRDSLVSIFHKKLSLQGIIDESPKDFIDTRFTPDEMSGRDIQTRILSLKRSGEKSEEWETQWHFKLSGPFVNLILGLIAMALSHNTIKGGIAKSFVVGLFITFCYYVLLKVGVVLGGNEALVPWAGAWFGNIIFGALASLILWRSIRL